MKFFSHCCILAIFLIGAPLGAGQPAALLTSTESDLDSFLENCVNVISGDYCESSTDLLLSAKEEPFPLKRFYNAKNYVTGASTGGWRILPQIYLVLGKDIEGKRQILNQEEYERVYAFTGERSGGILTYSNWTKINGLLKGPFKINMKEDGIGIVNTYVDEASGRNNHKNNLITCDRNFCQVTIGDGTKRTYQKVVRFTPAIFPQDPIVSCTNKIASPEYYRLIREVLPGGTEALYSYNENGSLKLLHIQDVITKELLSEARFEYVSGDREYLVKITTSDGKSLEYHFTPRSLSDESKIFALDYVKGTEVTPCSYEYQIKDHLCLLVKKSLPQEQFVKIEYNHDGKVVAFEKSISRTGEPGVRIFLAYNDRSTQVLDDSGLKTHYEFDNRLQLTTVRKLDKFGRLLRVDKKYFGQDDLNFGLLLAKATADGSGNVYFYQSFKYDPLGNIVEERIYTVPIELQGDFLRVDQEGFLINENEEKLLFKINTYSTDGLNLINSTYDSRNATQTIYHYKPGTDELLKQDVYVKGILTHKSFYHLHNNDSFNIFNDENVASIERKNRGDLLLDNILPNVSPSLHNGDFTPELILAGKSCHQPKQGPPGPTGATGPIGPTGATGATGASMSMAIGEVFFEASPTEFTVPLTVNVRAELTPVTTLTTTTPALFDSPSDGRLRFIGTTTTVFHVAFSISCRLNAGANDAFLFEISKNGTSVAGGGFKDKLNESAEYTGLAFHKVITLSTNDYISMFATNQSVSVGIVIFNLNIVAVGE